MKVVTISRSCYSHGKDVAERLAEKLNYKCISRDILLEASEQYNIPELKLERAIHDAPSILDRFRFKKEKYIAYIQEALLKNIVAGNVIYHGLAGHFLLEGVPHVLKIRIIANFEDRVQEEMKRDKINYHQAQQVLRKDDEERRKWSQHLYGKDPWDASLYDAVLHIDKLNIDDTVDTIANMLKKACFQGSSISRHLLEERHLAIKVNSILINQFPTVDVFFRNGVLHICVKDSIINKNKVVSEINLLLKDFDICKVIEVHVDPVIVPD